MTLDSQEKFPVETGAMSATLMTVSEMIKAAFGDDERNIVNFKIIQALLMIFAKQLRLLERRVIVQGIEDTSITASNTSIIINEVKLKNTVYKKKRLSQEQNQALEQVSKSANPLAFKTIAERASDSELVSQASKASSKGKYTKGKIRQYSKDKIGTSTRKSKTADSDLGAQYEKYWELLDKIEEQREDILRIITQRLDSQIEGTESPSPMASINSRETLIERLLIIQKISRNDDKYNLDPKTPLSVVTREQFYELVKLVLELEKRFDNNEINAPQLPDDAELMKELRKGASLTDAMGALQLSARLEACEKNAERLTRMITELLRKTKESELSAFKTDVETGSSTQSPRKESPKQSLRKEKEQHILDDVSVQSSENKRAVHDITATPFHNITEKQLTNAMACEKNVVIDTILQAVKHADIRANEAYKKATQMERKADVMGNLVHKIVELEKKINQNTEKVNSVDAALSSQLSNYQEQLLQMQFDLETGLSNVAEAAAEHGYDPELIAELKSNFSRLQNEIEKTAQVQVDALHKQKRLVNNVESLKRELEFLRDTKCDRDEVIDALHDKAGIDTLNGYWTTEQQMAVVIDMEKKIKNAYDRINGHERIWQKAIDDLQNKFDDKADRLAVESLRNDINKHLNNLKQKIIKVEEIVGEPLASGVTKRIYRDTACVACGSPAHPAPLEATVPLLPVARPSPIGAETQKPKYDGDHSACIPGTKIIHPVDARAEYCSRYCGGRVPKTRSDLSKCVHRQRVLIADTSEPADAVGPDEKMYKVKEELRSCPSCSKQFEDHICTAHACTCNVKGICSCDKKPLCDKKPEVETLLSDNLSDMNFFDN